MYAYYSTCPPLAFTTSSRRPSAEVVERRTTSSLKSSNRQSKHSLMRQYFENFCWRPYFREWTIGLISGLLTKWLKWSLHHCCVKFDVWDGAPSCVNCCQLSLIARVRHVHATFLHKLRNLPLHPLRERRREIFFRWKKLQPKPSY